MSQDAAPARTPPLLVAALAGAALWALASTITGLDRGFAGWKHLAGHALSLALPAMAAAGVAELRRLLTGWARLATTAAAVALAAAAAAKGASFVEVYAQPADAPLLSAGGWRIVSHVYAGGWIAGLGLVGIAGVRRARPWTVAAALGLGLALVAHFEYELAPALQAWPWSVPVLTGVIAALTLALVTVAIAGRAAPSTNDVAQSGFRRIGSALVGRMIITAVSLPMVLATAWGSSPAMGKMLPILIGAATVLTNLVLCTGLVEASRWAMPLAPRRRLGVAALFVAWGVAIDIALLLSLYHLAALEDYYSVTSVLAPLAADRWFAAMLGIAALLPLLSATFAAARAIGDHAAARQALVVAVWVLASLGGAAWLERFVESYRGIEPGLAALTMVMVAAANVITVLALSRLMHSIADALDRAPVTTLPSAVLRPRAS